MEPKVSVVIPCYNQGRFLAEAIESVLAQDYSDKEIIVVNDGSSDNTREVADRYRHSIVYVEQPNKGAAAARNAGIRVAKGEYIAFLDADDVCLPGRLKKEAAILDQRPEVGLVASDAYLINESGEILGLKSSVSGVPRRPQDFRWETVEYCATTSTVMVRKKCFDMAGYFDERFKRGGGEDWLAWVRIAHDFSMVYLDEPTVGYRVHTSNVTKDLDFINQQNRLAAHLAVEWEHFSTYPAHFKAKLLFYRFATSWHVEPKSAAFGYFFKAIITDPAQLPFGLWVIRRGLINIMRRRLGKR
ncbi:MAG: glycosyltransferase [Thermoflexales bacterium]|nr:glycosyltransferase [Thermoflexales bacterium]